jgi:putative protein-disulfide isomerase
MCSWCWGFAPVWKQVRDQLQRRDPSQERLKIQYVLGGLAADTDKTMPENMQLSIRDNWRKIQQEIPSRVFNFDFWTQCQPRRSTYPACRAVVACGMQRPELMEEMIEKIQQAYYRQAKNPSDDSVLIELAKDMELDSEIFSKDLNSKGCQQLFEKDLLLSRRLGVSSFPSLILCRHNIKSDALNRDTVTAIPIDYKNSKNILRNIEQVLIYT